MRSKKKASAASYQLDGTRVYDGPRRGTATIIPFERKCRPTAQEMQDASMFKLGVMVGFVVAVLICAAVMYLWVIPTMDGAVATAQQAVQMSAGVLHA